MYVCTCSYVYIVRIKDIISWLKRLERSDKLEHFEVVTSEYLTWLDDVNHAVFIIIVIITIITWKLMNNFGYFDRFHEYSYA